MDPWSCCFGPVKHDVSRCKDIVGLDNASLLFKSANGQNEE